MDIDISKAILFFVQGLGNLLVIVIIIYLAVNALKFLRSKFSSHPFKWATIGMDELLLVVAFSCLGLTIGLMIGLSQSPVVHVAIPAMLTFYSGFLTYLFTKESFVNTKAKKAILFSVIAISVFLIYGIEIGSTEKNKAVESKRKFDLYYFEQEEAIKNKYK